MGLALLALGCFVGPDLGDMIADNMIDPRKLLSLGDSAAEKPILCGEDQPVFVACSFF